CRSTRAFLQRLHQLWRRSSRFQSIRLPQDARHDLRWVASLLQNGAANRVPTSIMADTLEPAVHLFMDASNECIAVLYPAAREYIRLQFDEEERLGMKLPTSGSTSWFSTNVREALSAVLSVLVWGPQWQATCRPKDRPLHVRCWIDNASAVAWLGDHNTKNPAGQELTRVLYCAELSIFQPNSARSTSKNCRPAMAVALRHVTPKVSQHIETMVSVLLSPWLQSVAITNRP
ncbi:hypothetical protein F442_21421, partial [Phytophthora nicotianae P10297]